RRLARAAKLTLRAPLQQIDIIGRASLRDRRLALLHRLEILACAERLGRLTRVEVGGRRGGGDARGWRCLRPGGLRGRTFRGWDERHAVVGAEPGAGAVEEAAAWADHATRRSRWSWSRWNHRALRRSSYLSDADRRGQRIQAGAQGLAELDGGLEALGGV